MEVAMKASEIRAYYQSEWALVSKSKERYWAEHKRNLTPDAPVRASS
jgi:hypothetical protein